MITPSIGPKELKVQLDNLLDINMPVFVHGPPGIGKSYIVHELSKERNWQISDVRLSQLDAVDLRGIPSIQNEKTCWMPPVFLPDEGEGVLFLDELNSAPPSVQAAIYQLVLDRKIGEYEMPEGWRIICAGNRISDKGIVFRLPSPLVNRMVHLVVESNYEDFKAWAILNNIHPFIIGFLGFRPNLLSQELPKDTESNPAFATPRSWHMLSNIISNVDQIEKVHPLIYGAIGYAAGVEFLSYIKSYKTLPDLDSILSGHFPEIPDNPSTLYALVSALVAKFNGSSDQSVNLLNFSKNLSTEFGVMLIKDCVTKHESLCEVDGFDSWLEEHGDFIV